MNIYYFTFTLHRFVEDLNEIDELYEICDDASLESEGETTFVQFDREAKSLDEALRSAVVNVRSCSYEVQRIEAEVESVLT